MNYLELLKKKKALQILININSNGKEKYTSQLSREINSTHSHVAKTIKILESEGLIIQNKVGRKCLLKLTKKGKELISYLMKIKKLIEDLE